MASKVRFFRGSWWLVTHDGYKRTQRRLGPTATDKKKGEDSAARINAALGARRHGIALPEAKVEAAPKPRLRDFAQRYLDEDTGTLAPTTIQSRRQHLAAEPREPENPKSTKPPILPYLGDLPLDRISPAVLREWWGTAVEGEGRKIKTGREYVNTLAAVFHYARDLGLVTDDPISPLRAMLRRRTRTQRGRAEAELGRDVRPIADPGAIARLVAEARKEGLESTAYVLLGLDAGLRLGEACGLRWGSPWSGEPEKTTPRAPYAFWRAVRAVSGPPARRRAGASEWWPSRAACAAPSASSISSVGARPTRRSCSRGSTRATSTGRSGGGSASGRSSARSASRTCATPTRASSSRPECSSGTSPASSVTPTWP